MSLTLLIDLEDTLLDSNMNVFIPAYFEQMAGFLARRAEAALVKKELLAGSVLMYKNQRADLTLDQVFVGHLFPAIGVDRTELQPELDQFFDDVFPRLKEFSTPRPGVVELIEYAFAKGWRVVIATNPLFSLKAIEHHLRWANLPPEKYPFALITSMENSHFSKTIPAYYAEIMGNLGWPSDPVIMVGDDPMMDMESAAKAGLPVYWIRPEGRSVPELRSIPQGSISDFTAWIQSVDLNTLQPNLKTPEALISSLQSTPAVLDTLLRTLLPTEWTARPRKDEWAITEILCHLRDLDAEVNLPRLEILTSSDNAFITGQNTDPWAKERNYIAQDGLTAFQAFAVTRQKLIEKLKSLSSADWDRRARHTIFGPTHLQELVGFMAEHDRTHLKQATALLKIIRKAG